MGKGIVKQTGGTAPPPADTTGQGSSTTGSETENIENTTAEETEENSDSTK